MLKRISAAAVLSLYSLLPTGIQAKQSCPPGYTFSPYDSSVCKKTACCDPLDRCWADVDYLYWTIKDSPEPVPLVVQGPVVPSGAPILGQPGTTILLGGNKIKNDWRSGARFSLGYWFDDSQRLGAEVNYLYLPGKSISKSVFSDGSATSAYLAAPYFNENTNSESSVSIANPGVFAGTAQLKLNNSMQNAELNVIALIPRDDCSMTLSMLGGFRYWNFDEQLSFKTDSPNVAPFPSDVFLTTDKFEAKNNFYGGQVGLKLDYACYQFFFSLKGKVAVGTMHQEAKINGSLQTNDYKGFGVVETYPGGYFTMPTNLGKHKHDCFAVIPEANINFGYHFTDHLSLRVGYTFLFVNNVLWAGNEIDRTINPTQSSALTDSANPVLVGEARPKALMKSSNFWAQGLNVGLEFSF